MAGAAPGKQDKEALTEVQQNAIWREHVAKEQRHQKLYTHFLFNPFKEHGKPQCVLAPKPNSKIDYSEGQEDAEFLKVYRRAMNVPRNRFDFPQTEAHEIGWDTEPLVSQMRDDVRLHHPRGHTEITTYMEAYWRQKEQESMQ